MGQCIQEWTKWKLWKTAFKKIEVKWSAYANHLTLNFLKASSANFTWSILEHFVPNTPLHRTSYTIYATIFQCIFSITQSHLLTTRIYIQKQPPDVFYKKVVLKNYVKFTGKFLRQNLRFCPYPIEYGLVKNPYSCIFYAVISLLSSSTKTIQVEYWTSEGLRY